MMLSGAAPGREGLRITGPGSTRLRALVSTLLSLASSSGFARLLGSSNLPILRRCSSTNRQCEYVPAADSILRC